MGAHEKHHRPRWGDALAFAAQVAVSLIMPGCGGDLPPDDGDAGVEECGPGKVPREGGGCDQAGLPSNLPCPPGERSNAGSCQPAGLPPDMPCPPGEALLENGSCQPAGVPPEACGQGFEPDGEGGCTALLPLDPCPVGQMAVPGETVCQEIAPCGVGDYGDIPVEADTEYVNQAYAGADSDGSLQKPWKTVWEGVDAAANGAIVAVAAGTYNEAVWFNEKQVRLWGRCPAMVEMVGGKNAQGTIQALYQGASGSEIHGLSITGAAPGIGMSGASDVKIDGVWIHDTVGPGLYLQGVLGPTSVAVNRMLIEHAHGSGVYISGSEATIEASSVRDGQLLAAMGYEGRGINIDYDPNTDSHSKVMISRSLIERSREIGIFMTDSDVTIEASVVRDTLSGTAGQSGIGITVAQEFETGERSNLMLTASLIEHNRESGLAVVDADAWVETSVVRDTLPDAAGELGYGIQVYTSAKASTRSKVGVSRSLVADNQADGVLVYDSEATIVASRSEHNQAAGLLFTGSKATIEASVIKDTVQEGAGEDSFGILIEPSSKTGSRSDVTILSSLVDSNQNIGVAVSGSDAIIEASTIKDALLNNLGDYAYGVVIQEANKTGIRANVSIVTSLIENNLIGGVGVSGSDVTIEASVIRDTSTDGQQGGHGIEISSGPGADMRANVTISTSLVEHNHELGVAIWGSDATINASVIKDTLPDFDGHGGNGIYIDEDHNTKAPSSATIASSLVEGNQDIGVFVVGSEVSITTSIVRDTAVSAADGLYGDGVSIVRSATNPATAAITGALLGSNSRAGLSNFGAGVTVVGSIIRCSKAFDLAAENFAGGTFSFPNSYGTICGCPEAASECVAVTAGLGPPPALGPTN